MPGSRFSTLALPLLLATCGAKESSPQPSAEPMPEAAANEAATESAPGAPDASEAPAPASPTKAVIDPGASQGMVAFANALQTGGTVWVGPLAGNGGRDVLIYLPPGDDKPRPQLRLVYHFHGTYSERINPKQESAKKSDWVGWDRLQQTIDAIVQLRSERDYDVALVYPLSAGKRIEPDAKKYQRNKAYDRLWMLTRPEWGVGESFDALHAQVLERLDGLGVDTGRIAKPVIAEGHSAGGIALRNVAQSGTHIVTDYLFLDASFQGWADGAHAALRKAGIDAHITIVATQNGIADPYGRRDPWCTQMPLDAQAWAESRKWCAGKDDGEPRDEQKPPGFDNSCEQLAEAAQLWPETEAWCADYKDDLKHTEHVSLVRTKVYHGDQPRHFAGGLELPAELGVGR